MKIHSVYTMFRLAVWVMILPSVVYAADLPIADYPLNSGAKDAVPNLLFLVDDSGSMGIDFHGDDVFYAPGYDSDITYQCTLDSSHPVLEDVTGQIMDIYVSLRGQYAGTPYFTYNSSTYGWGPSGDATGAAGVSAPRKCFNPESTYQVRYSNYTKQTVACSTGYTASGNYCVKTTSTNVNYCPDSTSYVYSRTSSSQPYKCWKKSTKIADGSGNSCAVGYTYLSSTYDDCYLTSDIKSATVPACAGSLGTPSSAGVATCTVTDTQDGNSYLSPRTTDTTTNINSCISAGGGTDTLQTCIVKYLPRLATQPVTGNFLNWYFSNTESRYSTDNLLPGYPGYDSSGSLIADDTGLPWTQIPAENFALATSTTRPYANMIGNKPNVHWRHERIQVVRDVGKFLSRKITQVSLGLGSFWTDGAGTKSSSSSGWLMQELSQINPLVDNPLTTSDDAKVADSLLEETYNRTALITEFANLTAGNGTPTAGSIEKMARYIFQNATADTATFKYYDLADATSATRHTVDKTIAQVLPLTPPTYAATKRAYANQAYLSTDATKGVAKVQHLNQAAWCEKSALAILTDGQPSTDDSWDNTTNQKYDTKGSTNESVAGTDTTSEGIVRIPGLLYDHDFLPLNKGKQNIESFFIAFGAEHILSDPVFPQAGLAGGGGSNNTYPAQDGGAIIEAFKDIIQRVTAKDQGTTALAVSSTAALKTDNYGFQTTYNTEFYTANIKAFRINADGKFTNPDGTSASWDNTSVTAYWDAATLLNTKYVVNDVTTAPDVRKRVIFTWDKTNAVTTGGRGERFGSTTMTRPSSSASSLTEFNNLPAKIKSDLAVTATTDGQEQYDLMLFLMGDTLNEKNYPSANTTSNNKYRSRGEFNDTDADGKVNTVTKGGIFADIVGSSPTFMQEPQQTFLPTYYGVVATDSAKNKTYDSFKAAQATRKPFLFVGSNDGLLHAITVEAASKGGVSYAAGDEIFSYMPTLTASTDDKGGLHFLADPYYDHRFYVDQTPIIKDAFVDLYSSGGVTPEWRSILVSGLNKGGKGYYALDVTCPIQDTVSGASNSCTSSGSDFSGKNVLWEFGADDDADLGYSFSRPFLAKVKYDRGLSIDRVADGPSGSVGRWAMITGNGYNSTNGRAALFIVFLDGGLDGTWTEGVDYIKIYAPATATNGRAADSATNKNGLSSPEAADLNADGIIDRIYAGDLKGQMWVFDISAAATSTQYASSTMPWSVNRLFYTGKANNDITQPITTAPKLARDTGANRVLPTTPPPDILVVFGTGSYMTEPDTEDTSIQSIYAVHDRGTYNLKRYTSLPSTKSYLEKRMFTQASVTSGLDTYYVRQMTGNAMTADQYGWYVDLADDLNVDGALSGTGELTGERVAFQLQLVGSLILAQTAIPNPGSCESSMQSYFMGIDWRTGLTPTTAFFDANRDGVINSADRLYMGSFNPDGGGELSVTDKSYYFSQYIDGSAGTGGGQFTPVSANTLSERVGWEEKMPFGVKGQ